MLVPCRRLYTFAPQNGRPTLLTAAEDNKLVWHVNVLGKRGYSVDKQVLSEEEQMEQKRKQEEEEKKGGEFWKRIAAHKRSREEQR
jgi:hypothetical protein